MARTVVVIGGAGGGPAAAARARDVDEDARIVLVERRPRVAWVQAGLRYHIDGTAKKVADLDNARGSSFGERHRVEVRTSTEAARIDPESHRLELMTATGPDVVRYDALIFSGGADTIRPDIAGLSGPRVVGFRSADDLGNIRAALDAGAKRAVVLGGSGLGVDAADSLTSAGLAVTLVEKTDRILPSLSHLGACAAAKVLRSRGVTLKLRDEVIAAVPGGGQAPALRLASGEVLETDLVVIATGLRPNTQLLADAGASINVDGSVRTNPDMQTTLPSVYACGTAVSVTHAVTRAPLWLPQAAIAVRTAFIAGRNAAAGDRGAKETLPPMPGSALFLVGNQRHGRTGLSEGEARALFGDDRVIVITTHGYAGEPWIGGDAMSVRLIVDRGKSVVVGGEVWGREGVPRRVDLLSCAVEGGWSPARIAQLDMAYSPTLGPAHDPLQAAGRVAALTLAGEADPISAETLHAIVKRGEAQVIDVSSEGRSARWPEGTVAIPVERLRERIEQLDRTKPVVVVSQTGQRAYQGYRILKQRGFERVRHLDGGWHSYSLTMD